MNEKQKVTVYLTSDAKQKLDELFVEHLMKREKKTYSDIIVQAVEMLHEESKK